MLLPMFKDELALRPNCLLTRRPIYLLTGPRSIFYYHSPWKDLQHYLYEHGYKISVIRLPFQSKDQRQQYTKKIRHQLNQSHIFCDRETYYELQHEIGQAQQSTLTVFTDHALPLLPKNVFEVIVNYPVFKLIYRLHQTYLKLKKIKTPSASEVVLQAPQEIYTRILDHCVKLAEMDFYDLDLNIQS